MNVDGVDFFEPSSECRLFADSVLLRRFGYSFSLSETLGYAGALQFLYAKSATGDEPFFMVFGKMPNVLKGICPSLGGEWYSTGSGSVRELEYLTAKCGLPTIAELDFRRIVRHYPGYVSGLIGETLARWDAYGIFKSFPHEIVVLDVSDGMVTWADHLSVKPIAIPVEEFVQAWEIEKPEYGGERRRHLEYIVLPSFREDRHESRRRLLFMMGLEKAFVNLDGDLSGTFSMDYCYGLRGIEKLRDDLGSLLAMPARNLEFSVGMIRDLDSLYWKGLHRGTFADFLSDNVPFLSELVGLQEANGLIDGYYRLAERWKSFVVALAEPEAGGCRKRETLEGALAVLADSEAELIARIGTVLNGKRV